MESVSTFLDNFQLENLIFYLVRGMAAFLCIVLHEMSHAAAALGLGDETAQSRGRISFNPIHHIDPLGLLLMITVGFGWAKPVPVDMGHFKNPRQGMALTALAGPVSNFLLALVTLGGASALYHLVTPPPGIAGEAVSWLFTFLLYTTVLSVGLGVFNLIPIPPLDGSKVVFSLLPESSYRKLMYYERYLSIALFALVFLGVLDGPLLMARRGVLGAMCRLVGLPEGVL
jgi:Zn-dependent protease